MKIYTLLSLFLITSILSCDQKLKIEDQIQLQVDQILEDEGFSGSILISYKGKEIINNVVGEGNTKNTLFPIASITKLFVKHAVYILVQEGKLSLEDPLANFHPDIKGCERIQVKDLLYHTSGLPDIHNELDYFEMPEKLNKTVTSEELFEILKTFDTVYFPAGMEQQYSNSNYLLLADIIEKVSGDTLDNFLQKRIFVSFQMNQTGLYKEHLRLPDHAIGYYTENGVRKEVPDFNFRHFWGSGNGYSTCQDILKYMQNLEQNLDMKYARHIREHSGWYLGFSTICKAIPELDLFIVMLSNNGNVDCQLIVEEVLDVLKTDYQNLPIQEGDSVYGGTYTGKRLGKEIEVELNVIDGELLWNQNRLIGVSEDDFVVPELNFISFHFGRKNGQVFRLIINDNGEIIELISKTSTRV